MQVQKDIGILVILGVLMMICLAMGFIMFFNIHRKRMLEKEARIDAMEREKEIEIFTAATEAEEMQKEKIANNIHDEIIPILTLIQHSLHGNINNINRQDFNSDRAKQDMELLMQAIETIRNISHDLSPGVLFSFGFVKALGHIVKRLNQPGEISAELEDLTGFDTEVPFSKAAQLNMYRACLEILNNLYKHAHYSYLKVIATFENNRLEIDFTHDGKGITNAEIQRLAEVSMGLGLKSLQSRVLMLNATLHYFIEDDLGRITLSIPAKT